MFNLEKEIKNASCQLNILLIQGLTINSDITSFLDYINILNPKSGETYLEVKENCPELLDSLNIDNNYVNNNENIQVENNSMILKTKKYGKIPYFLVF